MGEVGRLLLGSLLLRPYVFGLLAVYILVAVAEWGWRRTVAFSGLAWALAFAAEFSSTRVGIPFGLYHYTEVTRGQELYLVNVPFFDSLSFTFLGYTSLGVGRWLLRAWRSHLPDGGMSHGLKLAAATGLAMMWLDLVIDPLAVRGDRWFLGRIFYYPEPGHYFGVPATNFVGWMVLGVVITGAWLWLEPRIRGAPPGWAWRLPEPPRGAVLLYYLILGFNLVVTATVAETALSWAGVAVHLPLAALVIFCGLTTNAVRAGAPASDVRHGA